MALLATVADPILFFSIPAGTGWTRELAHRDGTASDVVSPSTTCIARPLQDGATAFLLQGVNAVA